MFAEPRIAPSILSADFMHLGDEIARIEHDAGFVHVDVMDGHFVPNLTIGVPVLKLLRSATQLPLDVHLMITNPARQIPWFLAAGADIISFHYEAVDTEAEIREIISTIHEAGAKASLAIKPKTPPEAVFPYLEDLDMVLVMSVEPGFSGQSYMPDCGEKVGVIADEAAKRGLSPLIEVDGGIDVGTAPLVTVLGADVLVCGNAVYGKDDPAEAIRNVLAACSLQR